MENLHAIHKHHRQAGGELDWARIRCDLDERGYAKTPRVLSEDEHGALKGLFGEEDRFRSVIDMRRLRFGSGVYRYFDTPLSEVVRGLQGVFYPPLSEVADDWAEKLGAREAYPDTLEEFLRPATMRGGRARGL